MSDEPIPHSDPEMGNFLIFIKIVADSLSESSNMSH